MPSIAGSQFAAYGKARGARKAKLPPLRTFQFPTYSPWRGGGGTSQGVTTRPSAPTQMGYLTYSYNATLTPGPSSPPPPLAEILTAELDIQSRALAPGETTSLLSLLRMREPLLDKFTKFIVGIYGNPFYVDGTDADQFGSLDIGGVTQVPGTGDSTTGWVTWLNYTYSESLIDTAIYASGSLDHVTRLIVTGITESGLTIQADGLLTTSTTVDATPNTATAADIAAVAKQFVGMKWHWNGCHALASNIAAICGVELPDPVAGFAMTPFDASDSEFVEVYKTGGIDTGSFVDLLQPGDIVRVAGGSVIPTGHTFTVVEGYGKDARVVDNLGTPDAQGLVTLTEHDLSYLVTSTNTTIYRLGMVDKSGNRVPILSGTDATVTAGVPVSVGSLVQGTDSDGTETITRYFLSGTGGLRFLLDGDDLGGSATVSAHDFERLEVMGTVAGSAAIQAQAIDGKVASNSLTLAVTVDAAAPMMMMMV